MSHPDRDRDPPPTIEFDPTPRQVPRAGRSQHPAVCRQDPHGRGAVEPGQVSDLGNRDSRTTIEMTDSV